MTQANEQLREKLETYSWDTSKFIQLQCEKPCCKKAYQAGYEQAKKEEGK